MKNELTPEQLARCAEHGADSRYLDSIIFLDGEQVLKFFVELAMKHQPGTITREQLRDEALRLDEEASGVTIPGIPFKPFRFCSP